MFSWLPHFTMLPTQVLLGQLIVGLINGAFYAMLSLGLAVIFGLLTSSISRMARSTCWAPSAPG